MRNTPLILPLGVKNGTSNNGCLAADVDWTNLALQMYYFVKINIFPRTLHSRYTNFIYEHCKHEFFQDFNSTKSINNTREIYFIRKFCTNKILPIYNFLAILFIMISCKNQKY